MGPTISRNFYCVVHYIYWREVDLVVITRIKMPPRTSVKMLHQNDTLQRGGGEEGGGGEVLNIMHGRRRMTIDPGGYIRRWRRLRDRGETISGVIGPRRNVRTFKAANL